MNTHQLTAAMALVTALTFTNSTWAQGVVVIVNESSPIASADEAEVKRLYLGKTKEVSGTKVKPVNQSKAGAASAEFNQKVVGKSDSQLRAYWSKQVFTGKGKPPPEVDSDAEMLEKVASDPDAVGYVSAGSDTSGAKVVLTID